MIDGEQLLAELKGSGAREKEFWRARYADTLTYDQFHGKLWRAKERIKDRSDLFIVNLGTPLKLTGDWMICGDYQLPTTDYDFAALPMAVAKRNLSKPRQLLIVGDMMNMDSFSAYELEIGLPAFRQEVETGRVLLMEYFKVFDRIIWLPGNHERRISKRTAGAILMEDLITIINTRVETSNYDHAVISTECGDWYIGHGSEYSINQLTVADQIVQKQRMHVWLFHEHHLAMGFDRYGHNIVINGGGFFNQWLMAYTVLNTNKKGAMIPGFGMLRDGYPYLYGREPWTNWDEVLGIRKASRAA